MAKMQDIQQQDQQYDTHQNTGQEIRADAGVVEVLRRYQRIAVIGASSDANKPAYYVPQYMAERGYEVFAVNPRAKGQTLFGNAAAGELLELQDQNIDIVNVFRRSDKVGMHLEEMLELAPKLVWLQLGIRNDNVAKALIEAGIGVIQNRCMLADHRKLIAS